MGQTVDAVFDGKALWPESELSLPANTRVRVTIEPAAPEAGEPGGFLDLVDTIWLEGPPDWSERFEEYLEARRAERLSGDNG